MLDGVASVMQLNVDGEELLGWFGRRSFRLFFQILPKTPKHLLSLPTMCTSGIAKPGDFSSAR
jgi:hypothetical protein